ncbi:MAG: endonuclease III [Oscillospiraceae bacterium]|jgi:endonuclease-3|nr:endonuclease III [Oscillospiraceae bacterium]
MAKREKADKIIEILKREYPEPKCGLVYDREKPHELLIAARLSAQCADKRVNAVTPALFAEFPDIKAFAAAETGDIERIIKPCGLYKTKAADIKNMCVVLADNFGGTVPEEISELTALPGVGRKTANLIRGELYGKPAIVADTHVMRLSDKLGLTANSSKDALKTEKALLKAIPSAESTAFCHRLVLHGRSVCKARKPDCGNCALNGICESGKKQIAR